MKKKFLMLSIAITAIGLSSCRQGCTDPLALNYDHTVKKDNGTCEYPPEIITEALIDDIAAPTTLVAKNYEVCGNIYVSSELTVMPGAIFTMCEGSSITIESNGYMNATGTAENPIIFKGETAAKGFWTGIAFKSNNPNNKLIHASVSDAGTYWAWDYAGVYVGNNAQISMSNSSITNNAEYGLFIENGGLISNFSSNTFGTNKIGFSLAVDQVHKIDGASNYNEANTNDYVEVRNGTIGTDVTWPATTTPLLVDDLTIDGGLTLSPGSNIKMEATAVINVKATGYLNATGTSSNPITIVGRYASTGYWSGMRIESNNPNNKLIYTTIADGGNYWAYEYSNIHVKGKVEMNNCNVNNANSYGLYIDNGAQISCNSTIATTITAVEAANSFSGNGTGPDANCTAACTVFFE
ncbi:hypothetical protein [Putridiphycobacter roseus]|nr:hypothetical protein [Putridiphycobacter roseus]